MTVASREMPLRLTGERAGRRQVEQRRGGAELAPLGTRVPLVAAGACGSRGRGFAPDEPSEEDDIDARSPIRHLARPDILRRRHEATRVDCVGYDAHRGSWYAASRAHVVPSSTRHCDEAVSLGKDGALHGSLEPRDYPRQLKVGMLGVDDAAAEERAEGNRLHCHSTQRMRVHDGDALVQHDSPQCWEKEQAASGHHAPCEMCVNWRIVHLEPSRQHANPSQIAILVRQHDHLVAQPY